jgi:hypothetical protein
MPFLRQQAGTVETWAAVTKGVTAPLQITNKAKYADSRRISKCYHGWDFFDWMGLF